MWDKRVVTCTCRCRTQTERTRSCHGSMTSDRTEQITNRAGVFVEHGVVVDTEEVDLASADWLRRWVVGRRRHSTRKPLHTPNRQHTHHYNHSVAT